MVTVPAISTSPFATTSPSATTASPCSASTQEALVELDSLSWMGLNLHGTRLEVIVREEIKTPERLEELGYFDIVAQADGVVTHRLIPRHLNAQYKAGQNADRAQSKGQPSQKGVWYRGPL